MPMWRYIDETSRNSQVFGLLEAGDLVESDNPPHEGVAWFEPVGETETIDTRRLRPVWKYEHLFATEATTDKEETA